MEIDAAQVPLSHKALGWFEKNKKNALMSAGGLVVLGLIVAFVVYRKDQADITASEALSNVGLPQMTGAASPGDMSAAYLKVAAEYPSSRAGARALLLAAGSLFVDGKYPEAQAQFERFKREYANSPFMGEALLGIAACLNAQKKTPEAMAAYKDLIDHRPEDSVVPQARFALACLYAAQNEPAQARTLFEKVETTEYGSLGDESRMRLEEMKVKYPAIFAPVALPPSTNAAPLSMPKH